MHHAACRVHGAEAREIGCDMFGTTDKPSGKIIGMEFAGY
jgi:hypothetical protein